MPPSGYGKDAVQSACDLVCGCLADLRQEVLHGKHPSFRDGVTREMLNLRHALESGQLQGRPALRGNLLYIFGVYEELAQKLERGEGLKEDGEQVVTEFLRNHREALSQVHITDSGELAER